MRVVLARTQVVLAAAGRAGYGQVRKTSEGGTL